MLSGLSSGGSVELPLCSCPVPIEAPGHNPERIVGSASVGSSLSAESAASFTLGKPIAPGTYP